MKSMIQDYSAYFILEDYEFKKFLSLINDTDHAYNAFILTLLKEFDNDISRILRILNVAIKSQKHIINRALINYLIITIKEAIILSNYREFRREFPDKTITNIEHTQRFQIANIDRQTIIRTFRKYHIVV